MRILKISQKIKIASVVLLNEDGKVLILQRSKNSKNNPGRWNFPGGHIDKGESPKEAAVRECEEEAGITPKKVEFLGNYGKMATFIGYTNEKPQLNYESDDWKFISKKDIDGLDFTKNVVTVLNKVFNSK